MTRWICALLATLLAALAAAPARADDRTDPAARGRGNGARMASAARLDGAPSENAWEHAPPITGFLQREPEEGAAPSADTEVRVLYDATSLYVSVRAFDADPSRIVGLRTRRDEDSPSDWISVFIDSYHDRRTAYEFAVNAAGVKQDRYWFQDGNADTSWDAVWDVTVALDAGGWTATFRIPFSQLRFRAGADVRFGFAVFREIGRLRETSTWPLVARSGTGFVSQFGELTGLDLTGAAKRLELLPYGVAEVATSPVEAGDPFVSSPDGSGTLGADVKFAVTTGLTLTATVNPDFGQVEADPAVVNLSSFETFYQERRPFFVEGSGALKFDLDCSDGECTGLFYSRRIGRRPQGSVDTPDGGYGWTPAQTTIIGAAKLTGRAGGFAIGAMNAVTANEQARLAFGTERWSQTVEPLTNYLVAQARREWANRSSVGFMVTSTDRATDDSTAFLAAHALTGGANWDWRVRGSDYAVQGYWAGSAIRGSADAIDRLQTGAVHRYDRVDAGHLEYDPARTSLAGHAGQIALAKVGGARVRFSFSGSYKTPGFDVNDVGYIRRADAIEQSGWVQFRWDTPGRWYRSFRFNLNQWSGWNFDGDTRFTGANVNAHVTLPSQWSAGGGVTVEGRGLDDRSARGGPAFATKRATNLWAYVVSDSRKAVSAGLNGFGFVDVSGSSDIGFSTDVTWRPTTFLTASGGFSFDTLDEDTQWVENVDAGSRTDYVFGSLRQKTARITARVNYTVTPSLSIQVFASPFVSAGAFGHYKSLVHPRALPVAAQFEAYVYGGSPDFNYASFRMTNVVRWEYRPGSVLYVVWQQGRESVDDTGEFRFGRDLNRAVSTPGGNVFLVKASFWMNY